MKLLIIGSLGGQLIAASKIAKNNGARVHTASDAKAALKSIRSGSAPDLVMIDIQEDIPSFMESLKEEHINLTVVACGIEPDKERVLTAIKMGAKEFIPLPPNEAMIAAVFEAIASQELGCPAIGNSANFEQTLATAKQIAPTEASVLITGESGTGKEVIARFIHNNSKRKHQDFISVNCAAIPDNLLESELFGHEKGAFTGAVERRIGRFEQSQNSTLLLDEISEMDLRLQAKLLRAIQEREIVRVGGTEVVKLDVRFIATSNRNLMEEVKAGRFREDLFYRLNVISLNLPPLRERKEDIKPLSQYFIEKYAKLNGISEKTISSSALEKLESHDWPGNIRELENTIHRSLLLSQHSEITASEILITANISEKSDDSPQIETLAEMERRAISSALSKHHGDEAKVAMVLGITINALKQKVEELKLSA